MNWNLGDFILWHGCRKGDKTCWDTRLGRGRPSWNIQDPSMVSRHFNETLSLYCGGFDNLFRHHDYSIAILESVRPYPMARFWLHGHHLIVNGQKMSKSKGNIYYTDTLLNQGTDRNRIRFFLIYGHYREKLNYSDREIRLAGDQLQSFQEKVRTLTNRKKRNPGAPVDENTREKIKGFFTSWMDEDLQVRKAFDAVQDYVNATDIRALSPSASAGLLDALREIDGVLQVLF
jgi:cysteinyl-tRNA synthetase